MRKNYVTIYVYKETNNYVAKRHLSIPSEISDCFLLIHSEFVIIY